LPGRTIETTLGEVGALVERIPADERDVFGSVQIEIGQSDFVRMARRAAGVADEDVEPRAAAGRDRGRPLVTLDQYRGANPVM